jgi:hypothetical protein
VCALSSAFAEHESADADAGSDCKPGDGRGNGVAEWRGSGGGGQLVAPRVEGVAGSTPGAGPRAAAAAASFKALSESAGLISTQHVKEYLPSALKRIAALESHLLLQHPPAGWAREGGGAAPIPSAPTAAPPAAAAEILVVGDTGAAAPGGSGAREEDRAGAQGGRGDEGEEVAPLSPQWLSDAPLTSDDEFGGGEGGGEGGVDVGGSKEGEGSGTAARTPGLGAGWRDQVLALVCGGWRPCTGLGFKV